MQQATGAPGCSSPGQPWLGRAAGFRSSSPRAQPGGCELASFLRPSPCQPTHRAPAWGVSGPVRPCRGLPGNLRPPGRLLQPAPGAAWASGTFSGCCELQAWAAGPACRVHGMLQCCPGTVSPSSSCTSCSESACQVAPSTLQMGRMAALMNTHGIQLQDTLLQPSSRTASPPHRVMSCLAMSLTRPPCGP